MRSLAIVAAALLALGGVAHADPKKLTWDDVLRMSLASAKARMAQGDADYAAARVKEADAARLPKAKITMFGTISPEIECDDMYCTHTDPTNFALKFSGFYGSAQLDITEPLYTFGKIAHARDAARAGLAAQEALADEAAGDLAVDAARAYWGVKVARELGGMLDDGIEEIGKALDSRQETDKSGKPTISIQDRQRVAVLLAEAKAQRAEAAIAEGQALAGLRAIVGDPTADIDDAPLAADQRALAAGPAPYASRPQSRAAKQGAVAADALAAAAHSAFYPDLAVVGSAVISRAQGADDPPSAYAYDPYNREGAGIVLALQWQLEPWTTKAKAEEARAAAAKAHAQSDLAAIGAAYDAESARAEASGAIDKVTATADGEKAARTWLASVLQAEAIGTAESRDLVDAYVAWFQMRARWAQAVMQWNVAVVRLDRAAGEFHADGRRPKH
ncbi:MAG TPA: TolC family protein [Kofleriaceae bacterium]|jgi:outer membrane protein TolC